MSKGSAWMDALSSPPPSGDLVDAVAAWDRKKGAQFVQEAEQKRQEVVDKFPLGDWPSLSLERYAVGVGQSETFCTLLEFRSQLLGSIKGGSSRKLLIYKHKNKPGWYFDADTYASEVEAWEDIRSGFVKAFDLASESRFAEIDQIASLRGAGSLKAKANFVYFPDRLLPIYGAEAVHHFSQLLGSVDASLERLSANRALFDLVYSMSEFEGWSPFEIGRFLYWWNDPRQSERVVKIAPGEGARYWDDCLKNGYICVGWDEVGDLSEFPTKEEFRQEFAERFHELYNGHQGAITRKANELWTLRELEEGDIVVANKGISHVMAVGKVTGPYHWDDSRPEYKHTVPVAWDTSFDKDIAPEKSWSTRTVASIPQTVYKQIVSGKTVSNVKIIADVAPGLLQEIEGALLRRGQVILHGPPGTGKTFTARLLSRFFLREQAGHDDEAGLASKPGENVEDLPYLTRVTFHPSYGYEEFVEGYRPVLDSGAGLKLDLRDGIFKRLCLAAASDPESRYLLLIDEINRGNVPRILGELITLLEMDKRGLSTRLPQSGDDLAVPSNLYILGTMNTADRSIRLLDAALRRRFAFVELMPDAELLSGAFVGELSLQAFLDGLNDRIVEKAGREKQVGHSFFLEEGKPITDAVEFSRRMRQEVIPLLQEYAFDDFRDLEYYLGSGVVKPEHAAFADDVMADPDKLAAALWDAYRVPGEEE